VKGEIYQDSFFLMLNKKISPSPVLELRKRHKKTEPPAEANDPVLNYFKLTD